MSCELFRLVGVWSDCWVVRDAPPSNHSTHQLAENNSRDMQQHSFNESFWRNFNEL
jgi:hypothetical protein